MPATDYQSLLFSTNVKCYLNSPAGMQRVYRLSLLQDIANAVAPGVPTDYESLLKSINVPCYISESEDESRILRLALLQDIALGLGPGGGGGGSTWTPTTPISGTTLVEWLRGDDVTATPVSNWPAQVGQPGTASGAAQPTLDTTDYFHPAVRFNGFSNVVTVAMPAQTQPFTLAMVYSYKGLLTNNGVIISAVLFQNQASQQWQASAGVPAFLGPSDNNLHILVMVLGGASSRYGFDGAPLTTVNLGTNGTSTFYLGAGSAGPAFPGQVDIGEVLIWEGDASASYSNIFSYLQQRWLI